MSKKNIKQLVEFYRMDLECIDNLIIVEIDGSHRPDSIESRFTQELKKKESPTTIFFPASSCNRHVYIFDRRSLRESETPTLCEAITRQIQDERFRVYQQKEGLRFLLSWVAGGLNKGKYFNDTYNRRTVESCLTGYLKLMILYKTHEQGRDFDLAYNKMLGEIDREIKDIQLLKEESADEKPPSPDTPNSDSSASSSKSTTPSFDDRMKWLQTHREEIKRIKDFSLNRFSDEDSRDNFTSFIETIFKATGLLCTIFENTKYQSFIKALWSGSIRKESLEIIKENDKDFFEEIIKCRTDFIAFTTRVLVDSALEKTLTKEGLESLLEKQFKERIETISEKAEALLSVKNPPPMSSPLQPLLSTQKLQIPTATTTIPNA